MKKYSSMLRGAIVAALLLLGISDARATLTLTLDDGAGPASPLVITDNVAPDASPTAGQINFFGSYSIWNINNSQAISQGAAVAPQLADLFSFNSNSSGAGTLTITLLDTAMTFPTGLSTFLASIGGTTSNSTVAWNLAINGTTCASGGPFSTPSFADAKTCTTTVGSTYSLQLQAVINSLGPSTTSFDYQVINKVPEPGSMLLFGLGLVGLALWTTKRHALN